VLAPVKGRMAHALKCVLIMLYVSSYYT
jgi:hypothetical protein